jgi:hypothetical protein
MAPPKSTSGLASLLFAGALNKHYKRCEATINLSVGTRVASSASCLCQPLLLLSNQLATAKSNYTLKLADEFSQKCFSKAIVNSQTRYGRVQTSRTHGSTEKYTEIGGRVQSKALFQGQGALSRRLSRVKRVRCCF